MIELGREVVCIKTHEYGETVVFRDTVGIIKRHAGPYVFIEHGTGDSMVVHMHITRLVGELWEQVP